jgi:hypothetical protein
MVTTITPDTSAPGSNPGLDASLIGGRGFEPYLYCVQVKVAPVPMLVSSYVMGIHGAGGGQSTDASAWWFRGSGSREFFVWTIFPIAPM